MAMGSSMTIRDDPHLAEIASAYGGFSSEAAASSRDADPMSMCGLGGKKR